MNNRLESLLKLFEKEPEDTFLMYGIALEYTSLKKFQDAEIFFEKLLKKDPNYVPAYMQYARLKESQNDEQAAKNIYKQGIKIAKESGENHAAKEMEDFLNELE